MYFVAVQIANMKIPITGQRTVWLYKEYIRIGTRSFIYREFLITSTIIYRYNLRFRITADILAMARPSTIVIVKKNIIQQFERYRANTALLLFLF